MKRMTIRLGRRIRVMLRPALTPHSIIRELKASGGYDEPGLTIIVKNDAGESVFTIPFTRSLN